MSKNFNFFFHEMEGSPEESYSDNGTMEVVRNFLCDYRYRLVAASILKGANTDLPGGSGADTYLDFPELRATSVRISPFSGYPWTASTNTSDPTEYIAHNGDIALAQLEVTYGTRDLSEDPTQDEIGDGPINSENPTQDPIVMEYDQRGHAEMMSLPGRAFKWSGVPQALSPDAHPYKLIALADHVLTFHFVNTPPLGAVQALRGHVNEASLTIPVVNISIGEEMAMFYDFDIRREWTLADLTGRPRRAWEVRYTIKERNIDGTYGWNHAFDPVRGSFDKPVTMAGGNTIYPTASFTGAFIFR